MGAPGQSSGGNNAGQMIQQNAMLRQALLASAPKMRKQISSITGGVPGQTSRVKLFNVGITTRILLDVILTLDIGVATATLSPKAPFNLLNRVKLTDFDGTDRVNASGYQLWVLNSIREKTPYGYNNESQAAVSTSPLVPTAVGAAQQVRFQLEIPLAFDADTDLRGALLTQTAVGEAWLSIDWNSLILANGNADAVYNGAGTTTVANTSIQVNVFQEYLLPQSVGGQVPLPALDLMTVYEIAGALRSSDNIAAGQEKLFNYPNVRSVIGCYLNFINNSVMNPAQTDMSKFRIIANGNNVLREYGPGDKLFEQRLWMLGHADLRNGTYFELHRGKPIETALFGNVQLGFTPSSASGTSNFEVCFESFYTKGSMLPGLSQASG